jgi:hypothetical protein
LFPWDLRSGDSYDSKLQLRPFKVPAGTGKDIAGSSQGVSFNIIEPEILISQVSGHAGDQIFVKGSGFQASAVIMIYYDGTVMGSVVSNTSGAFIDSAFTIPASLKGQHSITARDSLGSSSGVNFNMLEPQIILSQASGRAGDQISVRGSGFQPGSPVTILFDGVSIGSAVANTSGILTDAIA